LKCAIPNTSSADGLPWAPAAERPITLPPVVTRTRGRCPVKHKEILDRFVRLENVKRYEALLKTESDETKRKTLRDLLAAERKRQDEAADPINSDGANPIDSWVT
jgi:hypothetical protein